METLGVGPGMHFCHQNPHPLAWPLLLSQTSLEPPMAHPWSAPEVTLPGPAEHLNLVCHWPFAVCDGGMAFIPLLWSQ